MFVCCSPSWSHAVSVFKRVISCPKAGSHLGCYPVPLIARPDFPAGAPPAAPSPQAASPRCHSETWHTSPSSSHAQHPAHLCLPFPAHLAWLPGESNPFPPVRKHRWHSQIQRKRPFNTSLMLLNPLWLSLGSATTPTACRQSGSPSNFTFKAPSTHREKRDSHKAFTS